MCVTIHQLIALQLLHFGGALIVRKLNHLKGRLVGSFIRLSTTFIIFALFDCTYTRGGGVRYSIIFTNGNGSEQQVKELKYQKKGRKISQKVFFCAPTHNL